LNFVKVLFLPRIGKTGWQLHYPGPVLASQPPSPLQVVSDFPLLSLSAPAASEFICWYFHQQVPSPSNANPCAGGGFDRFVPFVMHASRWQEGDVTD
jgi:hypothetical protein